MPIVRDSRGHATYVSFNEFYKQRPSEFFQDNPTEYRARINEARSRVLEAIRFASRPLWGRGTNHEIRAIGICIEDLANFVDLSDRTRTDNLRKQRRRETKQGLIPGEHRLRSPQEIARRRRALFRHSDIPQGYFRRISKHELDRFVDLMRWYLIEAAVAEMHECHEIELINNDWYVKVSVMDDHRDSRRRQPRRQVKWDDRSFHGRPRRDRKRHLRVA